jgi:hypothetical protein
MEDRNRAVPRQPATRWRTGRSRLGDVGHSGGIGVFVTYMTMMIPGKRNMGPGCPESSQYGVPATRWRTGRSRLGDVGGCSSFSLERTSWRGSPRADRRDNCALGSSWVRPVRRREGAGRHSSTLSRRRTISLTRWVGLTFRTAQRPFFPLSHALPLSSDCCRRMRELAPAVSNRIANALD